MQPLLLLAQTAAPAAAGNTPLRLVTLVLVLVNLAAFILLLMRGRSLSDGIHNARRAAAAFLTYEMLLLGALIMLVPFYWMTVTAFKDRETASTFPPIWTPSRMQVKATDPATGNLVEVEKLGTARSKDQPIPVVPVEYYAMKRVEEQGVSVMREVAEPEKVFRVLPDQTTSTMVLSPETRNFARVWYRPETTSRGQVNFLTYFLVSLITSAIATAGTLFTSALAAFAFARLEFVGKDAAFYAILATMMVPGQVLLIPNFLILSALGLLDTYAALVVPWLASVFTIFLMRQFFMTIPEDLWDAARIDGTSRFRYLWQIVMPLSKPVFITAGIFDFLNNWNSLLWPLIVTSTPSKRTLMVGLQNLSEDANAEFHILMAASCLAVFPVVVAFFFLQRFFIEGIARTGLK